MPTWSELPNFIGSKGAETAAKCCTDYSCNVCPGVQCCFNTTTIKTLCHHAIEHLLALSHLTCRELKDSLNIMQLQQAALARPIGYMRACLLFRQGVWKV